MTRHLFHWTMLGLVGLMTTTTVGCTRWIDVIPSTTSRLESVTQTIFNNERVPLVMDGFRMTQNGAPQNPSTEVEHRILNSVQETRLFSTLVPLGGSAASLGDKAVTARITFDETIDPHSGETAWKGFIIGASMFLLSPMIEQTPQPPSVTGLLEPPPVAATLKLVPKTAVAGACWVIVIVWPAFCAVTVSVSCGAAL